MARNFSRTNTVEVPQACCMKCGVVDGLVLFCDGRPDTIIHDNGPDFLDLGIEARYDALCLRCCDHNHG